MEEDSRRSNSNTFCYYFPLNYKSLQVCKTFYLKTLGISSKVAYNVFENQTVFDVAQIIHVKL